MTPQSQCIQCGRDSSQAPLIRFDFKGEAYWICPQHLPLLIHKPAVLEDKLPGIEALGPSEGHPH